MVANDGIGAATGSRSGPRDCIAAIYNVRELVSSTRNPLTELAWPTREIESAHLGKLIVVADLRILGAALQDSALYCRPFTPARKGGHFPVPSVLGKNRTKKTDTFIGARVSREHAVDAAKIGLSLEDIELVLGIRLLGMPPSESLEHR